MGGIEQTSSSSSLSGRGSATTAEATSRRAINFCHIFSAQIDLEVNDDSIQLPLTY
jgi:hypothetical protein